MSSIEISDDDDSLECDVPFSEIARQEKSSQDNKLEFETPTSQKPKSSTSKPSLVILSSDEDTEDYNISDDDSDNLPEVNIPKNIDERDNAIKNLFPSINKGLEAPCSSQSTSKPIPVKGSSVENTSSQGHVRMIGGVKVNFPVPPYGAQIALMSKVIEGIGKRQNCLLESPTGSGKTLALLCGALAWQQHEKARITGVQGKENQGFPTLQEMAEVCEETPPANISPEKLFTKSKFSDRSIYDKLDGCGPSTGQNSGKRAEPDPFGPGGGSPQKSLVSIHKKRRLGDLEAEKDFMELLEMGNTERIPTIYYGARTHKQIQQVVKEFSRTAYCGVAKMTILSSREYSCIRDFDRSIYASKNDMCRECIKNASIRKEDSNCKFYASAKQLNHSSLPPAFDLEDLVEAGREMSACPFFAARMMTTHSQIVFCPYNYLIDPGIRSSLQIELRDEIVILDEAHNIEDNCREAASFTFQRDQILGSLKELEELSKYKYANQDVHDEITFLTDTLKNWNDWFGNQAPLVTRLPLANNEAVFTWNIEEFITTLNNHNIGVKNFAAFSKSTEVFCRKLRDDSKSMFGVSPATGTLLEELSSVFSYIYREGCKHMDDYKPALVRNVYLGRNDDRMRWKSKNDTGEQKDSFSLRLMCMNPGVVFSHILSARSVILTSGTLTPLTSLHSELGADFPLQLSPNHVIAADRVWIGTLTSCPDGAPLECKSQSTKQTNTQDAIGDAVLWTCQVTPNGVLCFLPSYLLMDLLAKRWQETGLWRKLNEAKNVYMESRNVKDHSDVMEEYYTSAVSPKGALLFAVYRGKVSEGMDFKDHQARAVITVGIPYPNTFEPMVKEKMSYNDRHAKHKQLLSSAEWLRVQAYRALNQAVGRCVRHKQDWGAVLLIDCRFKQPYYTQHLSKWVRNFLGNNHHTFESLVNSPNSLESFMQNMTLRESGEE